VRARAAAAAAAAEPLLDGTISAQHWPQERLEAERMLQDSAADAAQAERYLHWPTKRPLGQGASGFVSLLQNKSSGELVVCKLCHVEDALAVRREVSILASLQHAHVIRYHGVWLGSVQSRIFMEYAEGGSLRARVLVALSCAADEARARLERALGLCLVTCSEAGGRRLESTANWLVHLHSDLSGDLSSDLAEPASGDLQAYYTIATDGPRAGQTSAVPIPASQLMHLYRLGVLPRDMKVWPVIGGKAWRSLGAEVDALEEAGSPRRSAEDEAAAKARIIQGRVRARQVRRSAVGAASKQQREGAVLRIQRNIREISRQQAARHIQWRSRQRQSRRGGGPP